MRGRVDRWVKEAADLAISACWLRMSHWLGKITISQPCFFFICIMGIIISLKLTAKFYKICVWKCYKKYQSKYKMSVHNEGDKKKKKKTKLGSKTIYHSIQIKFTCNLILAKQSYLTDPLGLILTGFCLCIFFF